MVPACPEPHPYRPSLCTPKGKPTPDESGRRGGFVYKASQTQGRQGQIKSFRDTAYSKDYSSLPQCVCCKIKTALNYKISKKKSNKVDFPAMMSFGAFWKTSHYFKITVLVSTLGDALNFG